MWLESNIPGNIEHKIRDDLGYMREYDMNYTKWWNFTWEKLREIIIPLIF
jgi:hypothetical protein